ncbi:YxeA family protein [Enterococcus faecium]|nr:YxeA family protein [Enterococcus faecium]MCZ1887108.1 YxeA family protein [Enterococcus faecium]MCZ1895564.1 YxeA family protein [Enterococcus faecium]MCZ1915213.1 YxeA family protein [Enterococcus faecium]
MKKILGLIVIILIAFIGWKGWDYYQSTYVGKDYYAVVKAPMPAETDIKADNGEVLGRGFKYNVDAYAENGEKRQLDFDVITSGDSANGSAYPEGTILQLKASEKRIIEKKVITSDKVPSSVKEKLGLS